MALDALCVKALTDEFKQKLTGLRIDKIYQPENDELIICAHGHDGHEKLLLSANASLPRACLTKESRENPATPPMFCMLLRKHLSGGRFYNVVQPGFERIIEFEAEVKNDFGDTVIKTLVIEIMGRHSNIILLDENKKVLSSIKHVDFSVSSLRQILPGIMYEYPPSQNKVNPLTCTLADFTEKLKDIPEGMSCDRFISSAFLGISSLSAREISYLAGVTDLVGGEIGYSSILDLAAAMSTVFSKAKDGHFSPVIIENSANGKLMDFSSIDILQYGDYAKSTHFDSISEVIDSFYKKRSQKERMAVRSASLTKLVVNNIARCEKKYEIQSRELADSKKKEKYRELGELICANMYKINRGDESVTVTDYNLPDCPEITIPLDKTLTPSANSQKYFKRYNKLKNAEIHLSAEIEKTKSELAYLETVEEELSSAKTLSALSEIREELIQQGYIKASQNPKKKKAEKYIPEISSYITSDGFTILIGKNNRQNDYLTTKLARSTDLWFHTKDIPGSHVVLKHEHDRAFSEEAIITAAELAAANSKAKNSQNVPVDYTLIKNVKKPNGARPGFVIFTDNKTLNVTPRFFE